MKAALHYCFFLFLSLTLFNLKTYAACELYSIDFITGEMITSQYEVNCGTVSSSQWTVNNDKCELTTSAIALGGSTGEQVTTPLMVEIVTSASTVTCNDYVIIQYQVDNGSWVTQDSITSCEMSTSIFTYNFNVVCGDTSAIKVRVIMSVYDDAGGTASEKLRVRDGGICVSAPISISPVELIGLKAAQEQDKIKISWATASESGNDYFLIQKSADGAAFESLAFVPGSGDSYITKYYNAYDNNPLIGTAYYRLKQVDYSGKVSYSKIVSVRFDFVETTKFTIFPNPCSGIVQMTSKGCQDRDILVVLYDMLGQKIYSKVTIQDSGRYFFSALDTNNKIQPGIYLVVGSSEHELFNQKLIINENLSNECVFHLSCSK